MDLLVSHVVLSIVVGVAGLCAGWWLHGRLPVDRTFAGQHDEGLIREWMSGLHGLSHRMAADVNEHNSHVGEVDRELTQARDQGSSKVSELVDRLILANRSVQTKLTETEGKLDELSQKMEHHASEARTDVLTGLSNRRAFQEEAVRVLSNYRETDEAFALVMIDIDRFKQVNDVHGHPFGDEVLRSVGAILRDSMRGRDLVTRYGGEEFAILMTRTNLADARRGAESVREIIEKTRFQFGGKALNLTISLGVAEIQPFEDMAGILKRTDQAMYAAKHAGRNRVYWHDGTLPHPLLVLQLRAAEEPRDDSLSHAPAFVTILLCVDGCEDIAREYGHAACKMALGVAAQAIRERLREMDLVARYSDFTFGMVLPDATLRNAICIGERLRKAVKETVLELEEKSLQFTVSLGIVEAADGDEMATLVERACRQLEQAQQSGGNRTGFAASALVAS